MSSRRGSMQSGLNQVGKRGIDHRLDAQCNEIGATESAAFYCILLRHQYRMAVGITQVRVRVAVMIGKSMALDAQAHLRQLTEKALGIADARHGMQAHAA